MLAGGSTVEAAQTPQPVAKPSPAPAVPPGQPATMTGQRFGGWILVCPTSEQSKAACVLVQQVSEALSRKVVFVWAIQYDNKGQLLADFRLPSGVFVNRGLIMKTDQNSEGLRVEYTRCDPGECQAVFSVSNELAKQLASSKTVTVAIALTNGNTANVALNMDGFTGALGALSAKAKPPKAE
jgi:invasion protein IalB